jgi:hypothetical protein
MKLNLIFIVMDLLTILAYPFVFVHGKIIQFSRFRRNVGPTNLMVAVPNTSIT